MSTLLRDREKFPLFIGTLITAFGGDVFAYFLFDRPYFSFLLIFFVMALSKPLSSLRVALFLIFLSVESFFFYGRVSLSLVYLIPVTIAAVRLRDRFWDPVAFTLVALLFSLVVQIVVIEYYLLGTPLFSCFTFLKLLINIILTIFLSML